MASNGKIRIVNVEYGNGVYEYSINGEAYQEDSHFYNLSRINYTVIVRDILGCTSSQQTFVSYIDSLSLELHAIQTI